MVALPAMAGAQSNIMLTELPGIRNKEDFVDEFFTDYKGMLWLKTANKIYRFTGGKDESPDSSIAHHFLIKEAQYFDTSFYISYRNRTLVKYNIKSRHTTPVELPALLKAYPIFLAEQKWFLVFAEDRHRLYKLRYGGNTAEVIDSISLAANDVKYLGNETLLIMKGETCYLFDMKTGKTEPLPFCEGVSAIRFNRNNLMAIKDYDITFYRYTRPAKSGFALVREKADTAVKYQYAFALDGYHFYREFGSNFYYLRDTTGRTKRFRFINKDGLPYIFPTIYAAYIDPQERFFISSEKGIFYFDLKATGFMEFYLINTLTNENTPANLEIRNAFYDRETKQLYLGSRHEGVIVYGFDSASGLFRYMSKFLLDEKRKEGNTVTSIYMDRKRRLWINTNLCSGGFPNARPNGFSAVWDMTEDSTEYWFASPFSGFLSMSKTSGVEHYYNPDTLHDKPYTWSLLQKDSFIFVCSHQGLSVFDKIKRSFDHPLNRTFATLFKDQMCWQQTADFYDTTGSFVCTQASGLYHVSYNGTGKTKLLPGIDEIYQCYSGAVGNLATSTHNLYFFERALPAYIRMEPGVYPLAGNFAFKGFCRIGDERLCVTGTNGFTIIRLPELKKYIQELSPSFFIQEVDVLNHSTYHYPQPEEMISLAYNENNIKVKVNTDCIGSLYDMNICYLFAGLTDTFRLMNTNEISFSNLAPGEYTLQIFCQAANGIWNRKPLSLVLRIAPPWYAGFGAKISYTLLGIFLLAGLFQFYKTQAEKKRRYALIKLESELKSLRSQMNPHFMFNALNAIQQYVLRNDKENANIYLSNFARLVRQTLDNTGKETLPLKEEISWLTNYLDLERLRHADKFDYRIETSGDVPMDCEIPTMMIQPFVENAILHGVFHREKDGRVLVKFSAYNDALLQCTVEDNGPGISTSGESAARAFAHQPRGMSITEQRMTYINQKYKTSGSVAVRDLTDTASGESGTRIIILLPFFNKDAFF
jgi:hypothetical protein